MARAAALLASVGLVLWGSGARAESWTPTTPPPRIAALHAAVSLPDGSVLQLGGIYPDGLLSTAYRYVPSDSTWKLAGASLVAHASPCATLAGGTVYVLGGARAFGSGLIGAIAEVDRYRVADGTWSAASPMAGKRRQSACAALGPLLLVAGGRADDESALASAELYDPAKDAWTTVAPMPRALAQPQAAVVPGTSTAIIAGEGGVFLFDGAAWTDLSSSPTGVPTVTALPLGVLITGAGSTNALVYTPAKGLETVAPMKSPRTQHAASALADGRIIVTGGEKAKVGLTTAEVFDPVARTWSSLPDMPVGRFGHTQSTLADGRVLLLGGVTAVTSFTPAPMILGRLPGLDCKGGGDCALGHCADGVCCASACEGPCERCDGKGARGTCASIDGAPVHGGCGPYASCVAGACPKTCAESTECSEGNVCYPPSKTCGPARGLCDDAGEILDPVSGTRRSCAPFNCNAAGDCLTQCGSSLECAPGHVCNGATCVAASAPAEEESGGCATGRARASGAWSFLLLAALLGLRRARGALLVGLLGCRSDPTEPVGVSAAAATFSPGAPMTFSLRLNPTLTKLPDGRVLVTGGSRLVAPSRTAEVFDPATSTFTASARLSVARSLHTAVALADGRVLVIGGYTGDPRKPLATTELWDPATGAFAAGPSMVAPHARLSSARLADGRVVVVAGEGSKGFEPGAELLDAEHGAWSALPAPPDGHRAVFALPNGKVLAIGGEKVAASVLDLEASTWTARPTNRPRAAFAAAQLADGRVVVAGGTPTESSNDALGSVELFDVESETWTSYDGLAPPSYFLTATTLRDGKVLILGGANGVLGSPSYNVLARAMLFDPAAGALSPAGYLLQAREQHTAVALDDGRVLVVGGTSSEEGVLPELYNVPVAAPCASDVVCASGFCVDGVCCATRCGTACTSCNVAGSAGTCTPISGAAPQSAEHQSCAPYAWCVAGACATACSGDALCDAEHVCDPKSATCVEPVATCDDSTVIDRVSGARRSCAPYRCEKRGTCLERCKTSDDCAAGAACDNGRCAMPASADVGGCAIGHGAPSTWLLLTAALAAAVARRTRGSHA